MKKGEDLNNLSSNFTFHFLGNANQGKKGYFVEKNVLKRKGHLATPEKDIPKKMAEWRLEVRHLQRKTWMRNLILEK